MIKNIKIMIINIIDVTEKDHHQAVTHNKIGIVVIMMIKNMKKIRDIKIKYRRKN